MSSASNVLYIEPSFNSDKFRSEFRLPESNGVYKTDMRLTNVGLAKNDNGNTTYNLLAGAYGVIDSISIESGAQTLDQVRNFSQYISLKNLLHSNNENSSVYRYLARNKLGYAATGSTNFDAAGDVDQAADKGVKISNKVPDKGNTLFGADAGTRDKATNGSWFNLKECLGFLRDSPYIPTNVYPDLRIIVNYVNSTQLTNTIVASNSNIGTEKPLLVAEYEPDVAVAESLMNNYEGVSFNSIEHDSVLLTAQAPAQNTTAEQESSFLLKGFNDKFIDKLVIVNTPQSQATWRTGNNNTSVANLGSVSQLDFGIQVRLNGVEMFPTPSGYLEGKNRRMGRMVDAWGDMNVAPFQNMCGASGGPTKIYEAGIVDTIGQVDYTGFGVSDVVKELKLTCKRTAVGGTNADATLNPGLRQAIRLNIFGVARKNITPLSNGQILIRYV